MKIMCGIKNNDGYVALSGLGSVLCPLTQDFVSLRPELLHFGALPLLFQSNFLKILKGFNVIAPGAVKRSPERRGNKTLRAESPICFIDTEVVRFKTFFNSFQINKTVFQ